MIDVLTERLQNFQEKCRQHRLNFLGPGPIEIIIPKNTIKEILDDFEACISYSLQIASLFDNSKSIYTEDQNKRPYYTSEGDSRGDLTNYKFFSPTNTENHFQAFSPSSLNRNNEFFNPTTDNIYHEDTIKEKAENAISNQTTQFKSTQDTACNFTSEYYKSLNLNFDYSSLANFRDSEHQLEPTNYKETSQVDPFTVRNNNVQNPHIANDLLWQYNDQPKKKDEILIIENNSVEPPSKEYNSIVSDLYNRMNNKNSQVENVNNNKKLNLDNIEKQIEGRPGDITRDFTFAKNTEVPVNENYVNPDINYNFNELDRDSERNNKSTLQYDHDNEEIEKVSSASHRLGIRQMLKSKAKQQFNDTRNGKQDQNNNSVLYKKHIIKPSGQFTDRNLQSADRGDRGDRSLMSTLQAPKHLSLYQNYSPLEKEVISTNLLKRIARLEDNGKQYLANKYANGSYTAFIRTLHSFELDIEELEQDLKNMNESANPAKTVQIPNKGSAMGITLQRNNSYKTATELRARPQASNFNRRPQSSQPRDQHKRTSSTEYIEPVNFESILRNTKKPVNRKEDQKQMNYTRTSSRRSVR